MQDRLHLFLNGGGDAPDTEAIDRAFVGALGDGPLFYWPFARPFETYSSCLAWFGGHCAALGVKRFEMVRDPVSCSLAGCGGLYIGGGDPYRLFNTLRESGLDRALSDAARGGLPVFGGSAGAIVLGADIATWTPAGKARPSVRDCHGLDLLDGYSIWAEYEPGHAESMRAWVSDRGSPLLGLSCSAGLIVERGAIRAHGRTPVVRVDAISSVVFLDGERVATAAHH
jgi:dipeptidase E